MLERGGITGVLLRAPKAIAGEGCGYAVKVSERRLAQALVLLNRAELRPKGIYIAESDGSYRQVGP